MHEVGTFKLACHIDHAVIVATKHILFRLVVEGSGKVLVAYNISFLRA